jgi:hypothetical protein
MDTPEIDNFGRDGVELRKKTKGVLHGQFGVCNSAAYKLQQVFRHWLLLLLGVVGLAFLVYIVIVTILRGLSSVASSGGQLFSGVTRGTGSLVNSLASIRSQPRNSEAARPGQPQTTQPPQTPQTTQPPQTL